MTFLDTAAGVGAILRLCIAIAIVGGGFALVRWLEPILAPVVSNFALQTIEVSLDQTRINGLLIKRRDCEVLGADLMVGDADDPTRPRERLAAEFPTRGDGARTFSRGEQSWGPIDIEPPATAAGPDVFMVARHRCHPLWTTRQTLFAVPRERLFR